METLKGLFPTEDPEPACDHVRCLDCGWSGCWADCVTEEETESVDGHVTARYMIAQCKDCGGWNTEAEMSEEQAERWSEWHERR